MILSDQFTRDLEKTIEVAKAQKYVPTYFMQMLAEHGGVETAKRLLASTDPQPGLFRLYDLGLLSDSMEAVVIQKKYKSLFTAEELQQAHKRLHELGYIK
jgi:hypothetical protein